MRKRNRLTLVRCVPVLERVCLAVVRDEYSGIVHLDRADLQGQDMGGVVLARRVGTCSTTKWDDHRSGRTSLTATGDTHPIE
jgi:hypothetical protein